VAYDGLTGQDMAQTAIYDIIILDRMLPGKDGLEVLKDLRTRGIKTPVIILTAKDTVKDKVEGLDSGADDYLVKPFSSEELLARIRALSRRQTDVFHSDELTLAGVTLCPLKSEIAYKNKTIKLTTKETQLLELFFRNKGHVLTRGQILDRVWGLDSDVDMSSVDIYIYTISGENSNP